MLEVDVGGLERLELARAARGVEGHRVRLPAVERHAFAAEQRERLVGKEDLPGALVAALGAAHAGERVSVEHAQAGVLGVHRLVEGVADVAPHVGGRRGREPALARAVLQERGDGGVEARDELLAVVGGHGAHGLVAEHRENPPSGAAAHVLDCREAARCLHVVQAAEPVAHRFGLLLGALGEHLRSHAGRFGLRGCAVIRAEISAERGPRPARAVDLGELRFPASSDESDGSGARAGHRPGSYHPRGVTGPDLRASKLQ
ncbi:MAG TPA: hypothetical protein VE987_21965 [Polyangiaceae bacterium]|nr:hypothetical protein [Polyangiaceae bacterium]